MRIRAAILLPMLICLLAGCRDYGVDSNPDGSQATGKNEIEVQPNVPFELALGGKALLEGTDLRIEFSFVNEDSRCASNVTCTHAGRAIILLTIADGQFDPHQLVAHIPGLVATPYRLNDIIQFENYRYRLLRLNPYPIDGVTVRDSDYRALIDVEKLFD